MCDDIRLSHAIDTTQVGIIAESGEPENEASGEGQM
jgi:hypothetical protein